MRGRFITFEGGEGTGKSTQLRLLGRRLEQFGIGVVLTREPGGSPGAEAVRYVLLAGAAKPLGAYAETLLFAAARGDHVESTIEPALSAGDWVLCDRFADSTRVYQGTLGNVDRRVIAALERVMMGETRPDLTLILDLPAKVGLGRAARRRGNHEPDRFEAETLEFHTQLRDAYCDLAEQEPERCVIIDASGSPEAVAVAVWGAVSSRFGVSQFTNRIMGVSR